MEEHLSSFKIIDLPTHADARGALTVMDGVLPFTVARSFWIYGADGMTRGGHRHHVTCQGLVAIRGTVVVFMDDGQSCEEVELSSPDQCIIVEPKDWHQMRFSEGSILLAFASHKYIQEDYFSDPYGESADDCL